MPLSSPLLKRNPECHFDFFFSRIFSRPLTGRSSSGWALGVSCDDSRRGICPGGPGEL